MAIDPIPPLDRTSPTFRADSDYYFAVQQPNFSTQAEAARLQILGAATSTGADAAAAANSATAANASKVAAAGSATAAAGSATTASTQATNVLDMDKRYLGAKAAPPALDNQGAALQTGANYYDTVLAKLRVWAGAAWVDGISAVAGVTSVNGASGAVVNIATTGANTFTADQTLAGKKVINPLLEKTLEVRGTAAIAAGVLALDLSNAITSVTLNANITSITFASNLASATACQSHTLELIGDGTQRTVVWPAGNGTSTLLIKWPGGTAPASPTLTTGKVCTYLFKSRTQFLWDAYEAGANQ